MLIPTKHQKLNENLISIGSELLKEIKKGDKFVEDLFDNFKDRHERIHLDNFFLALIFLWLVDAINMEEYLLKYKK
ncbi:MAG: hypothetical protein KKB88_04425 [Nanoarchaeota archaeon]|nr:hypothetical protein [Nanoarchaeota archaeon]